MNAINITTNHVSADETSTDNGMGWDIVRCDIDDLRLEAVGREAEYVRRGQPD